MNRKCSNLRKQFDWKRIKWMGMQRMRPYPIPTNPMSKAVLALCYSLKEEYTFTYLPKRESMSVVQEKSHIYWVWLALNFICPWSRLDYRKSRSSAVFKRTFHWSETQECRDKPSVQRRGANNSMNAYKRLTSESSSLQYVKKRVSNTCLTLYQTLKITKPEHSYFSLASNNPEHVGSRRSLFQ